MYSDFRYCVLVRGGYYSMWGGENLTELLLRILEFAGDMRSWAEKALNALEWDEEKIELVNSLLSDRDSEIEAIFTIGEKIYG